MKTWEQGEADFLREARIEWLYSTAGVHEVERYVYLGLAVRPSHSPAREFDFSQLEC